MTAPRNRLLAQVSTWCRTKLAGHSNYSGASVSAASCATSISHLKAFSDAAAARSTLRAVTAQSLSAHRSTAGMPLQGRLLGASGPPAAHPSPASSLRTRNRAFCSAAPAAGAGWPLHSPSHNERGQPLAQLPHGAAAPAGRDWAPQPLSVTGGSSGVSAGAVGAASSSSSGGAAAAVGGWQAAPSLVPRVTTDDMLLSSDGAAAAASTSSAGGAGAAAAAAPSRRGRRGTAAAASGPGAAAAGGGDGGSSAAEDVAEPVVVHMSAAATATAAAGTMPAPRHTGVFQPSRSYSQHIKSDGELLAALAEAPLAYAEGMGSVLDSIIKIYTVHSRPNYTLPWQVGARAGQCMVVECQAYPRATQRARGRCGTMGLFGTQRARNERKNESCRCLGSNTSETAVSVQHAALLPALAPSPHVPNCRCPLFLNLPPEPPQARVHGHWLRGARPADPDQRARGGGRHLRAGQAPRQRHQVPGG